MTKKITNKLSQRGKNVETLDPTNLVILGELDQWKLTLPIRRNKAVIVFQDTDGRELVVDGRHSVARAQRDKEPVRVIHVQEGEMLGKQTVLERLVGMLSKKKEK